MICCHLLESSARVAMAAAIACCYTHLEQDSQGEGKVRGQEQKAADDSKRQLQSPIHSTAPHDAALPHQPVPDIVGLGCPSGQAGVAGLIAMPQDE